MITYVRNSLFDSPAQTLVNTVNTVGVMGKGIAKEFKERYPPMFAAYRKLCLDRELEIGQLQIWRAADRWVLNFPTKTTWRQPSKISYIEAGLQTFVASYKRMGISSVAFPPLGCGNGNLDWTDVRPLMERYLDRIEIPVYIHDRQVPLGFVPEHESKQAIEAPTSFEDFLADVHDRIAGHGSDLKTLARHSAYSAAMRDDESIIIQRRGGISHIRDEHLEWAWSALQSGLLTFEQYPSDESRRAMGYLIPILAQLPYVKVAEVSRPEWRKGQTFHGLYFARSSADGISAYASADSGGDKQLCLYPGA